MSRNAAYSSALEHMSRVSGSANASMRCLKIYDFTIWLCRASCQGRRLSTHSSTPPPSALVVLKNHTFRKTYRTISHADRSVPAKTQMPAPSCTPTAAGAALTTAPAWSPSGQDSARLLRQALSMHPVALEVTRCLRLPAVDTTFSRSRRSTPLEACRLLGDPTRVCSSPLALLRWVQAEDWKLCWKMKTPE